MHKYLHKFAIQGLNTLCPTILSRHVRKFRGTSISNCSQQLMGANESFLIARERGERKRRELQPSSRLKDSLPISLSCKNHATFTSRYKELHWKRRARGQDVKDPLSKPIPPTVFCFVNARWSKIRVPSFRGRRARGER